MKVNYDYINPNHYKVFETLDFDVNEMMRRIWGDEALKVHLEMNAFEYKMRAGHKPDQPIERDVEKAMNELCKAKELKALKTENMD